MNNSPREKYGQPEHKGNGDTIGSLEELVKVMSAPHHTSPEKDYERNHSHYHCWDQNQPPACGMSMKKHEQCCLCDLKHNDCGDTPPSTQNNQTFVEKTLEEFREKFYGQLAWRTSLVEQWLSTKLDEAAFSGFQRGQNDGYEGGKNDGIHNERTRILTLIEKRIEEAYGDPETSTPLTSLAAELQDFRSENA